MLKKLIKKFVNSIGFDIVKFERLEKPESIYSTYSQANKAITDIELLADASSSIPGMIATRSGQNLYSLCYMQKMVGDVVEIGSWQGRSTLFLGNAVKDSSNGQLYAIDHFKGNIGKEEFYTIDNSLENLKENFLVNIADAKLMQHVALLDMPAYEAADAFAKNSIRFLFIDGDHTYEGVKKDIELFFPKLLKGAIVVFDDYFEGFPGLVKAVEECVIEKNLYSKIFYYRHTLVIEVK